MLRFAQHDTKRSRGLRHSSRRGRIGGDGGSARAYPHPFPLPL